MWKIEESLKFRIKKTRRSARAPRIIVNRDK